MLASPKVDALRPKRESDAGSNPTMMWLQPLVGKHRVGIKETSLQAIRKDGPTSDLVLEGVDDLWERHVCVIKKK